MICEYGCGLEAKHQLKNGKWCCSSHYMKCSFVRNKYSETNNSFYGKKHTDEVKKIISKKNKNKKPWNKGLINCYKWCRKTHGFIHWDIRHQDI